MQIPLQSNTQLYVLWQLTELYCEKSCVSWCNLESVSEVSMNSTQQVCHSYCTGSSVETIKIWIFTKAKAQACMPAHGISDEAVKAAIQTFMRKHTEHNPKIEIKIRIRSGWRWGWRPSSRWRSNLSDTPKMEIKISPAPRILPAKLDLQPVQKEPMW